MPRSQKENQKEKEGSVKLLERSMSIARGLMMKLCSVACQLVYLHTVL